MKALLGSNLLLIREPRFDLYLPATAQQSAEKAEAPAEVITQSHVGGDILVMDDEPLILAFIEKVLIKAGYRASCVHDGEAVIAQYQQRLDTGSPMIWLY